MSLPIRALTPPPLPLRQTQRIPAFLRHRHRSHATKPRLSWGPGEVKLSTMAHSVKSPVGLPAVPPKSLASYQLPHPPPPPLTRLQPLKPLNGLGQFSPEPRLTPCTQHSPALEGSVESTSRHGSAPSGVSAPPTAYLVFPQRKWICLDGVGVREGIFCT